MGLRYLPPTPHNRDMKDSVALNSLIPISVVAMGFDWVTPGHPCYTFLTTILRQNGF